MLNMKKTNLAYMALCAMATIGLVLPLQAQEKKADPSGTWSWTTPARGGGDPRKTTLTLKVEDGKLTGTIATPGRQGGQARETPIENGKIQGDEISFTVTREFGNNKMVQKYSGKVSGDTIKGKVEFERNGQQTSRDWEAKREKQ